MLIPEVQQLVMRDRLSILNVMAGRLTQINYHSMFENCLFVLMAETTIKPCGGQSAGGASQQCILDAPL